MIITGAVGLRSMHEGDAYPNGVLGWPIDEIVVGINLFEHPSVSV